MSKLQETALPDPKIGGSADFVRLMGLGSSPDRRIVTGTAAHYLRLARNSVLIKPADL